MSKTHSVKIEGSFRTWADLKDVIFMDGKRRPFVICGFDFEAYSHAGVFCRRRLQGDETPNSYWISTVSRESWLGYFGVEVFPEAGYCEFTYRKNAYAKGREQAPKNYQDLIASLTVALWPLISKSVVLGGDANG